MVQNINDEYIKEKILAAKHDKIKEIASTYENEKDIKQIKDIYLKDLIIHYVNDIMEVLDLAVLEPENKDVKNIEKPET